MAALETFPPKSRAQCCGTCRHWGMKLMRKPVKYCSVLRVVLPSLIGCGCAAWSKERFESFALGLYAEIEKELSHDR